MTDNQPLIDALTSIVGANGLIEAEADAAEAYLAEERGLYHGHCIAIVRPATTEETAAVVTACVNAGVPVVPQGGNTGLVGGGVPEGGVVVSTARLNKIRNLDPVDRSMTVEAGCILANIQSAADDAGLLFPLSLASEGSCQIGGNLSTNAGGVAVLRYGNTRELVLGVEVVLPDGRIWNGLRSLRKNNTGYDLKHLFIGAEGTLGIVTAAVLKLFPKPKSSVTALIATPDPETMLHTFAGLQDLLGDNLTAFELFSRRAMDFCLAHVPGSVDPFAEPHAQYGLIQLTSPRPDEGLQDALESVLAPAMEAGAVEDAVIAMNEAQAKSFWHIRESIPEAQKSEGGSIKHDVSVPVSRVPEFLRLAGAAVEGTVPGIRICAFGHLGDGNIHYNLSQPEGMNTDDYLARWDEINRIVHDIALDLGGSFSAEHGIGKLKRHELAHYKDAVEIDLMRAVKSAFDPDGMLNPGKVLPDAD